MPDNAVYLDQGSYQGLDLTDCGVPTDIRALDWIDNKGELHHYDSSIQHIKVTELPDWAIKCVAKWEEQDALENGLQ